MATLRILFVDDDRGRARQMAAAVRLLNERVRLMGLDVSVACDYAASAAEGIELLKFPGDPYHIACLDHDMAPEHYVELSVGRPGDGTGMDVARFISENPGLTPARINCHSWNRDGRVGMARLCVEAIVGRGGSARSVSMVPFPAMDWLLETVVDEAKRLSS